MQHLRFVLAVSLLLGTSACMSTPPPLQEEEDLLSSLSAPFEPGVALTLRYAYTPRPFPIEEPDAVEPNAYDPPLSDEQRTLFATELREALGSLFGREKVWILPDTEDSIAKECEKAENLNAQLLLEARLVENRISCKGPDLLLSFVEFIGLCFYPFHWIIPNERFEVSRRLEIAVYDVRDPAQPIYKSEANGRDERVLSEFEHGLVFLNTFRRLGSATIEKIKGEPARGGERYDGDNWQGVYEDLAPHASRDLQRTLLTELDTGLRNVLQTPQIRQRLEEGDPARARFYTISIGQNGGDCRYAVKDAEALHDLFLSRAGVRPNHGWLLTNTDRETVLATIARLRTKSVDRVLFYFAGQGMQTAKDGQGLMLGDGPLWLSELAEAFEGARARNVVFLLDTSFGGESYRARGRGRRTAAGSLRELSEATRSLYLEPLANVKRGWQVLCAAGSAEATGEYELHGLLTGLILEELTRARTRNTRLLASALGERVQSRSEALFGRAHRLTVKPLSDKLRQDFQLLPETAPRRTPKKTG